MGDIIDWQTRKLTTSGGTSYYLRWPMIARIVFGTVAIGGLGLPACFMLESVVSLLCHFVGEAPEPVMWRHLYMLSIEVLVAGLIGVMLYLAANWLSFRLRPPTDVDRSLGGLS